MQATVNRARLSLTLTSSPFSLVWRHLATLKTFSNELAISLSYVLYVSMPIRAIWCKKTAIAYESNSPADPLHMSIRIYDKPVSALIEEVRSLDGNATSKGKLGPRYAFVDITMMFNLFMQSNVHTAISMYTGVKYGALAVYSPVYSMQSVYRPAAPANRIVGSPPARGLQFSRRLTLLFLIATGQSSSPRQ
jgi:hypothetical protein